MPRTLHVAPPTSRRPCSAAPVSGPARQSSPHVPGLPHIQCLSNSSIEPDPGTRAARPSPTVAGSSLAPPARPPAGDQAPPPLLPRSRGPSENPRRQARQMALRACASHEAVTTCCCMSAPPAPCGHAGARVPAAPHLLTCGRSEHSRRRRFGVGRCTVVVAGFVNGERRWMCAVGLV